jgi:hypothetical protein
MRNKAWLSAMLAAGAIAAPAASSADEPLEGVRHANGWLNSPPLTKADLRGKVVLVDFWTYTCINWLRTLRTFARGPKSIDERIWLVSFMDYDLGFFDHETCRLESGSKLNGDERLLACAVGHRSNVFRRRAPIKWSSRRECRAIRRRVRPCHHSRRRHLVRRSSSARA